MPRIAWDQPKDRLYENGLDHGVLYMPDGSAVPWNGLISVQSKSNMKVDAVHFDGMKIGQVVTVGEFEATLRAVSYPREFEDLQSMEALRPGIYLGDQPPETFALCYRTFVGDEARGQNASYKIHVIYNVVAVPSGVDHETRSDSPSAAEMEWDLYAVPEEVEGYRPTAHFVIKSDEVDPWLLEDVEAKLYGDVGSYASLLPMADLIQFLAEWARLRIVDNGDGTWSAIADRPGFFENLIGISPDAWQINEANAQYLDDDTYIIEDTVTRLDLLDVRDNGDGTWTAITSNDAVLDIDDEGVFILYDVDPIFSGPESFRIQSKSA